MPSREERELALTIFSRGQLSMPEARKAAREQLARQAEKAAIANINKPAPVEWKPKPE